MALPSHLLVVVAQSQIESQTAAHLPVILSEVRLVEIDIGTADIGVDVGVGYRANHEAGKRRAGPGQALRVAREPVIEIELAGALEARVDAVHVPPELGAEFHRMLAADERDAVHQLLHVHRQQAADGTEAGRKTLQVGKARKSTDSGQRDIGHARGQTQLGGRVGSDARRHVGKMVARVSDAQLVDQARRENVRVGEIEILVAVIVVADARDRIREVAVAGAGVIVLVVPESVAERDVIMAGEVMVRFGRHLPGPLLCAQVRSEVVRLGEGVARSAVRPRIIRQDVERHLVEPARRNDVAREDVSQVAAAVRIGARAGRIVDRDQRSPGIV